MSTGPAFVLLRGGLALPLAAVELALDLERRGVQLRAEDDGVLFVGPRERITDEDRIGIRRWKSHLLNKTNDCRCAPTR